MVWGKMGKNGSQLGRTQISLKLKIPIIYVIMLDIKQYSFW